MHFGDSRLREFVWDRILPEPNTGCWLWVGFISEQGYGRGPQVAGGRLVMAHRMTYETQHGPLAKGLELDHLCRVRSCCNPEHLEAVTHEENVLRGDSFSAKNAELTHCKRGHEYVEGSYYIIKPTKRNRTKNGRHCKTCHKVQQARHMISKGKYCSPAYMKVYLEHEALGLV